jgi:hypothetical protein
MSTKTTAGMNVKYAKAPRSLSLGCWTGTLASGVAAGMRAAGGMRTAGGLAAGRVAAGLIVSWPGTHILRPQPGQKAALSGISAWHCGHEMGMIFLGQAA